MGRTLNFRPRGATIDTPWPSTLTPGDRLQRLYRIAPDDARAIVRIIDDQLRIRWPSMPRKRSS